MDRFFVEPGQLNLGDKTLYIEGKMSNTSARS